MAVPARLAAGTEHDLLHYGLARIKDLDNFLTAILDLEFDVHGILKARPGEHGCTQDSGTRGGECRDRQRDACGCSLIRYVSFRLRIVHLTSRRLMHVVLRAECCRRRATWVLTQTLISA